MSETEQVWGQITARAAEWNSLLLEREAAVAAIARVRALCTQWLESSGYYERWMGAAVLSALEPVVVVADPAGQPAPSEGATTTTACDAPSGGTYMMPDGSFGCRCIVCPRCGHHTGNSNQGHYWRFCRVIGQLASRFHFCCPGDCELAEATP